ncbi:MAG: Rne/Rng family ribonuclease [Actinomycetaceae bacterium]|nr:Rne/Rng family ribonuclease [Actinomycetaceae bacterium]
MVNKENPGLDELETDATPAPQGGAFAPIFSAADGGFTPPAPVAQPNFSAFLTPAAQTQDGDGEEKSVQAPPAAPMALVFQAPDIPSPLPRASRDEDDEDRPRKRRERPSDRDDDKRDDDDATTRRRRQKVEEAPDEDVDYDDEDDDGDSADLTVRRRRRRRTRTEDETEVNDEVTSVKGSTRLEAKRQRRRETRRDGRRRQTVTESEFLARRESVKREMVVREKDGLNQIAVLEDGLLVEHYVARRTQQTMVGNIYLGRVQNVLPSMEAAFVDLGKGRNAVLYAGEVNWDAVGAAGRPRRIEQALKSGDTVLVQVTKDPIGHKGARLTAQITLAGRYLVLVPGGQMTGISRKLPDKERARLKKLLGSIVPKEYGVIVRTAAEGASEAQLRADVERLKAQWEKIEKKQKGGQKAPALLRSEPELAVRVVRDVFNEDFSQLIVQGKGAWETIDEYVRELSPDLHDRLLHWVKKDDVFAAHRIDEQLTKGMDRKVWLPSGGSLIIDRTEAMTVIDVNTGKFIGSGGTLEETVTKNNLEAAEEIVRQLRLRDIGGIVVIDFVDMVLEANRDLVLRRLVECLGRDRTRHQVTEITSLGLVQMTRKRVGEGLVEAFSTSCECCEGRGFIVHADPVERDQMHKSNDRADSNRSRKSDNRSRAERKREDQQSQETDRQRAQVKDALSAIAAATASSHQDGEDGGSGPEDGGGAGAGKEKVATAGAGKGKKAKSRKAKLAAESEGAKSGSDKSDGGESASDKSASGKADGDKSASNESASDKSAGAESSGNDSGEAKQSAKTAPAADRAKKTRKGSEGKAAAKRAASTGEESSANSGQDGATEAPSRRRRGRRAATMSAGKPAAIELPQVQNTAPTIARPAALSVDDIELPQAGERRSSRTRRAVMVNTTDTKSEQSQEQTP